MEVKETSEERISIKADTLKLFDEKLERVLDGTNDPDAIDKIYEIKNEISNILKNSEVAYVNPIDPTLSEYKNPYGKHYGYGFK